MQLRLFLMNCGYIFKNAVNTIITGIDIDYTKSHVNGTPTIFYTLLRIHVR